MYKLDQAMKQKYQKDKFDQEKADEIRDRKILERVKRTNLVKQHKKLQAIAKRQQTHVQK